MDAGQLVITMQNPAGVAASAAPAGAVTAASPAGEQANGNFADVLRTLATGDQGPQLQEGTGSRQKLVSVPEKGAKQDARKQSDEPAAPTATVPAPLGVGSMGIPMMMAVNPSASVLPADGSPESVSVPQNAVSGVSGLNNGKLPAGDRLAADVAAAMAMPGQDKQNVKSVPDPEAVTTVREQMQSGVSDAESAVRHGLLRQTPNQAGSAGQVSSHGAAEAVRPALEAYFQSSPRPATAAQSTEQPVPTAAQPQAGQQAVTDGVSSVPSSSVTTTAGNQAVQTAAVQPVQVQQGDVNQKVFHGAAEAVRPALEAYFQSSPRPATAEQSTEQPALTAAQPQAGQQAVTDGVSSVPATSPTTTGPSSQSGNQAVETVPTMAAATVQPVQVQQGGVNQKVSHGAAEAVRPALEAYFQSSPLPATIEQSTEQPAHTAAPSPQAGQQAAPDVPSSATPAAGSTSPHDGSPLRTALATAQPSPTAPAADMQDTTANRVMEHAQAQHTSVRQAMTGVAAPGEQPVHPGLPGSSDPADVRSQRQQLALAADKTAGAGTVMAEAVKEVATAASGKEAGSEGTDLPEQKFGGNINLAMPLQAKTESATSAPLPTAGTVPGNDHAAHVARQIADRLTGLEAKNGSQQLTLRLTPENLGELKLNLRMDGQRLNVEIVTDSHAVKNMILQHSDSLRESLARQNISMETFDVTTGGNGGSATGRGNDDWRELARQQQSNAWMPVGGYRQPAAVSVPNLQVYLANSASSMVDLHF